MAEQGVRFKARRVIGNFLRDDIAYSIDDLFQVLRCEFAFIDTHGLAEVGKVQRIERLVVARSPPIVKSIEEATNGISGAGPAFVVARRRQASVGPGKQGLARVRQCVRARIDDEPPGVLFDQRQRQDRA